ncbi:MAG: tetratricopeptide repeat protein [Anaerolineales bacterium]|nr:tetratricopeptide repeat protein [Anaerolineales bacterium]
MQISDERPLFRPRRYRPNPYVLLILLVLVIAAASWAYSIIHGLETGEVQPLFAATATPTRTVDSYLQEAAAFFEAGDLVSSIAAFEDALRVDPDNAEVLAELARVQTYYSSLLTPDRKTALLDSALENINRAVELDPMNSDAHAVRALVLDWNSAYADTQEEQDEMLLLAYEASVRAVSLDNQNALALAYQAEVLLDQFKWTQARQLAELALNMEPNAMDTHRVFAYVLESTANYSQAIDEYKKAAEINPNFTYLYIKIGQNYRQLQLYEDALDYFDRAATINEVNGIQDPLPYIAIAKTYSRDGEFFIAARNIQRALEFDPTNADTFGQLGIVYFRSRNYEGSIPAFKCAIEGCTAEETMTTLGEPLGLELGQPVNGLALNDFTAVYYYTYGSVLAALDQCAEAVPILQQVADRYPDDPVAMSIVQEGLVICGQ